MSTRVAVLTPAGSGAIATVAVQGPEAWSMARQLFRPAKGTLPEQPPRHRFWFGTLAGGDEVVLAMRDADRIEVHCHGGRRVVQWVVEEFQKLGGEPDSRTTGSATTMLARATTTRTASILLDQFHGAFDTAIREVVRELERGPSSPTLSVLRGRIPLGRHLVEPWRVVLAGPPNVGKSSLLNALAGFQRSVVSPTAGTTRDVVTVPAAFEGWPVELAATAGLRRAAESLEQAGIDQARKFLANADLVVWLLDASASEPEPPGPDIPADRCLVVPNKCDLAAFHGEGPAVSAKTGEGVAALATTIARRLVPEPPPAGAAVPFLEEHFKLLESAHLSLVQGQPHEALRLLRFIHPASGE